MAERSARRDEVLAVVTRALATDTAVSWEARLRPLGIPVSAVRSLPGRSTPPRRSWCRRGVRLVAGPIKVAGYEPEYRPAPALDEFGADQSS